MPADENSAYVIVEETVQRVYHLDPENPDHVEFFDTLRNAVIDPSVLPSPILGKRSKKGAQVHEPPLAPLEERVVLTGLTLLNRVDGVPVHEVRWTNTTVVTKPVKG